MRCSTDLSTRQTHRARGAQRSVAEDCISFAMDLLSRAWDALARLISRWMAHLFDWRARTFEASGVAARRRELIGTVPEGGSVLEIGAGTGSTVAAGAYAGAPGRFSRIVATEPDDGMRAKLEQRATKDQPNIEVSDARLPALPFEDASFDAVACFMVLSHVRGRKEALKEICRVLKVGGILLLMDHGAHEHGHEHGHGHGNGHGNGHGAGERGGLFFWFREWFHFVFMSGPKDAKIEVLLEDFEKEDRLRENYVGRMPIKGFPIPEICYGSFTRVD